MAVTRQSVMPRPLECLEAPAIAVLLAAGYVVVCAGGGSVPVIRAGDEFRGVEAVKIGTLDPLRDLAAEGHFADGNMGPKVEAACRFAELGGRSVITSLHKLASALHGATGTIVEPS